MSSVFKILSREAWREAEATGRLPWSAKDIEDGFVHLSAAEQVAETARRHFAGQEDLVLVELDAEKLSELRWEVSRGGARFPHVYGEVPVSAVVRVGALESYLNG